MTNSIIENVMLTLDEKIDVLTRFLESEIGNLVEEYRKESMQARLKTLSEPVRNQDDMFVHVRTGGIIEGLSFDTVKELRDKLKMERAEKE